MAKSMVLHFFAGALADFPSPEDADHIVLGCCDDGIWYSREYGGVPVPLEGVPGEYLLSVSVALVAGTYSVVLATPIAAAAYRIGLSVNSDEVVHWENKDANGFDVVSSNGASTATVDVIITRTGSPL